MHVNRGRRWKERNELSVACTNVSGRVPDQCPGLSLHLYDPHQLPPFFRERRRADEDSRDSVDLHRVSSV